MSMGRFFLSDSKETINKKIKRATTDSGKDICFDPQHKPGVSNLLTIQAVILDLPIDTICQRYQTQGYGKLKSDTAEVVISALDGIQTRIKQLLADRGFLRQVLISGTQRAEEVAQHTLQTVSDVIGFVPRLPC